MQILDRFDMLLAQIGLISLVILLVIVSIIAATAVMNYRNQEVLCDYKFGTDVQADGVFDMGSLSTDFNCTRNKEVVGAIKLASKIVREG